MAQGWDVYLRAAMDRRRVKTASELSQASGIGESLISRWLRGSTQPDVANLRRLSKVLQVPLLELMVAAGHITSAEARLSDVTAPEVAPVTVPEAVEEDPVLAERAKQHLLDQYEMLRELSVLGRSKSGEGSLIPATSDRPLRAVARKRPPRNSG